MHLEKQFHYDFVGALPQPPVTSRTSQGSGSPHHQVSHQQVRRAPSSGSVCDTHPGYLVRRRLPRRLIYFSLCSLLLIGCAASAAPSAYLHLALHGNPPPIATTASASPGPSPLPPFHHASVSSFADLDESGSGEQTSLPYLWTSRLFLC